LLDRAVQQGWIDDGHLIRELVDSRGRTGNRQLRRLLAGIEPGAHAESERRLHAILRRGGVLGWFPQYRLELVGRTVIADAALPDARIVLEVDGRRYHDAASDRFEDDRLRQNALIVAGWRVLRFTWRELNDHPDRVLRRIQQLLAA
jgi:very-short-patch-repair endonuclease